MENKNNVVAVLFVFIYFLLGIRHSFAQDGIPLLGTDPVFVHVLNHQINYPKEASDVGVYAKIYAGFRIDAKGHIQDVCTINPIKLGFGFEQEIIKKLKRLPSLNPRYEGSYALPINFCLKDSNNTDSKCATGMLPRYYYSGRTLLDEITVTTNQTRVKNQQIILSSKAKGSTFIVNP